MKFKKQIGLVTQPDLSNMSKTKTLFIDAPSASRKALADNDVLVHGDVSGMCSFLLAKGHTKRLYGIISDVNITHQE
jgi:hypothetical protein